MTHYSLPCFNIVDVENLAVKITFQQSRKVSLSRPLVEQIIGGSCLIRNDQPR